MMRKRLFVTMTFLIAVSLGSLSSAQKGEVADKKAKSPYGALGIMRVLPSTAKWLGVMNYNEIEGNIRAGAKYMARLMKRYAKEPEISKDNVVQARRESFSVRPGSFCIERRKLTRDRCKISTPFGFPVEPDVYIR